MPHRLHHGTHSLQFLQAAADQTPIWRDGCTAGLARACIVRATTVAVVVFVLGDALFVANLGDSKAVLCRTSKDSASGITALRLTKACVKQCGSD